jgi:hypothetical protein
LESFVQLVPPSSQQQLQQIQRNTSGLWTNLRTNSQRAAGIFLYNEDSLYPRLSEDGRGAVFDRDNEMRKIYGKAYLADLKRDLIVLARISRKSNVSDSLNAALSALTSLCHVAALQVPFSAQRNLRQKKQSFGAADEARWDDSNANVRTAAQGPLLLGRATVQMFVQKADPTSPPLVIV